MKKSLEILVNENSFPSEREEEYFLTDKKVLELLKQVRIATIREIRMRGNIKSIQLDFLEYVDENSIEI